MVSSIVCCMRSLPFVWYNSLESEVNYMSKTDKELTVEVVTTYLEAWFNSGKTSPLDFEDLQLLITKTYETVQNLPTEKD